MSQKETDYLNSAALIARLTEQYEQLDLPERLMMARREISGHIVFTTSFGIEDQAITHAIFTRGLDIDLVTLDTGRLFPETVGVWAETERRYGRAIRGLAPDRDDIEQLVGCDGVSGFRRSLEARLACCAVRKVEPLARALAGASGWITGLRAGQSRERASMAYAGIDPHYRIIKVNPLFDWTRDRVVTFVRDGGVPYNPLHDRGFLSIGCAPCTRAIAPGEPERAGRWWWEQEEKTECGLHAGHPAWRPEPRQFLAGP
jgi:phosphoadenosine phosphosulfate reductase